MVPPPPPLERSFTRCLQGWLLRCVVETRRLSGEAGFICAGWRNEREEMRGQKQPPSTDCFLRSRRCCSLRFMQTPGPWDETSWLYILSHRLGLDCGRLEFLLSLSFTECCSLFVPPFILFVFSLFGMMYLLSSLLIV